MVLMRAYSFGTIALPFVGILKYALLWVVAFLAVGIAEEFAFRGYLQYTLTRGMGFWPASNRSELTTKGRPLILARKFRATGLAERFF
jgi:hypothetical protein